MYVVVKEDVYRRLREDSLTEQSDRSLYEFEDFQPLE